MLDDEYSLEAIMFQTGQDFPETLDKNFQSCIDHYPDYNYMENTLHALSIYIKKHTGLNFTFEVFKPKAWISVLNTPYMATAVIPNITSFNPMSPRAMKRMESLDLDGFVPEELLNGVVDYKNAKVSGFYSEIEFKMELSDAFFAGRMSAKSITAIALHEMGHAWDYCTKIGDSLITSSYAAVAVGAISEESSVARQVVIGNALLKSYGLKDKVTEDNVSPSVVAALLVKGQPQRIQNRTTRRYEAVREAERMADQFAVRWGRQRSLFDAVLELKKANGITGSLRIHPTWSGVMWNIAMITGIPWKKFATAYKSLGATATTATKAKVVGGMMVGTGISLVIVNTIAAFAMEGLSAWLAPHGNLNDTEERLKYIKLETIALLKTNPPEHIRKQALEDLEYFDKNIAVVGGWKTILGTLTGYIASVMSGRYQRHLRERTEVAMINNPLYELNSIFKGL